MTFANVLLICTVAIAGCAALVFAVETLVAFCLHEQEQAAGAGLPGQPVLLGRSAQEIKFDRAA